MNDNAGHLYAVELSGGEVKIGRTVNPQRRLANHRGGYKDGRYFITDLMVGDVVNNEKKLIAALKKIGVVSRGNEYFFCDFDGAVGAIKAIYENAAKFENKKEEDVLVQVHITKELDQFICKMANKDSRTRAGLVRRWLELIKAGKIKVEGIG
jgi:hypothetical protein